MMIIPKVLGLSVTVFVDKDPATEYTCLHRTSRTAGSEPCKGIPTEQCYIESKAVSTYFIQYRISPTFKLPENANHLAFDLYVDGKFFVGKSVHRDSLKGTNDYICSISYRLTTAENGTSYSERLTFQNLSSSLYSTKACLQSSIDLLQTRKLIARQPTATSSVYLSWGRSG
jgi:hypothetical protein